METKNNVLVNVLVLIVGIVFIFMQSRGDVINAIVIIMGILFITAAAVNLLMMLYSSRRNADRTSGRRPASPALSGVLASVAAIALGIWMTLDPAALVSVIVYIFAGLLLLGGIYHVYMLAYGYRPMHFPGWMYIFPSLLIIAGVVILCMGAATVTNYIVLITGIAMVIFSVSSFLEYAGRQSFAKVDTTRRQELNP